MFQDFSTTPSRGTGKAILHNTLRNSLGIFRKGLEQVERSNVRILGQCDRCPTVHKMPLFTNTCGLARGQLNWKSRIALFACKASRTGDGKPEGKL